DGPIGESLDFSTVTLTGISRIDGGAGHDTLTGSAGADTIVGGSGNDVINGGAGDDRLEGGVGQDVFVFSQNSGRDIVADFAGGEISADMLDFASAGINASTMVVKEINGNTVFTINGSSTVTVEGVTGMQFGTHWTALGTYTPPVEEPPGGDEEPTGEAGIDVSNLSLNVAEGGASDTTDVVLTRKPTSDVTITLGSDGGVLFSVNGGAPAATPTLIFTPANWKQSQTVTVIAVDDPVYESFDGTTIYFEPIVTQDPLYQEVYPPSGWATIADNDTAPEVAPPEAQAMTAHVWEDNPVVELQGNGYSAGEFGITEYMIVSQPVEGGTVTMIDDRTFRFEGDKTFLSSLNRGEVLPVTFEYAVKDGDGVWSAPATMTFNVHGFTNGADETYEAFTMTTDSQTDFLDLNGGDGIDTVVFRTIEVTSGSDVSVGLDQAFHWTEYAGKSIINTENITIKDTKGDTARTMAVNGNNQGNVITIENTDHKLFINGLGGDDTFNFKGTGNGRNSVITTGAGNDTVNAFSAVLINDRPNGTATGGISGNDMFNLGTGVQKVSFGASNGNDVVNNFVKGEDKLEFLAEMGSLGGASVAEVGGNTVFTSATGGTVTVTGVTGLVHGTDWTGALLIA
ncbi:hypothetical protein JKG68_29435, partial [Microvirga aerilata]|nr:hypothetical protein [Microvirga aerilata]